MTRSARRALRESFAAKHIRRDRSRCWPWTGAKTGDGYGAMNTRRTGFVYAHRFALEERIGRALRRGAMACHTCDSRDCVNPDHLYEGNAATNLRDAWTRGRRAT